MHRRLLEILECPVCNGGLKVVGDGVPDVVETGRLQCGGCGLTYPVVRGIPRMFPEAEKFFDLEPEQKAVGGRGERADEKGDKELAAAVKLTVTQYSDYQGKVYAPMADKLDNAAILEARTGIKMEQFKDRIVLDAGCGAGRMTRVVANAGAKMAVGFDAGHSIDEAKRLSESMGVENMEWVQGDILRAPFKESAFDRVMSIGVLHHTVAPDQGFRKLAGLVNKTGSMSVYLYTHPYVTWDQMVKPAFWQLRFALILEPFRRLMVRMPNSIRLYFCRCLWIRRCVIERLRKFWIPGRLLARVIERITPGDVYKPLEDAESNIARSFDAYSTPYNYTHDFTEVIDWYEGLKRFRRVDVTPYRLSMTGYAGEARTEDEPMEILYRKPKSIEKIEARGVDAS